jgi:hypothetical protein
VSDAIAAVRRTVYAPHQLLMPTPGRATYATSGQLTGHIAVSY